MDPNIILVLSPADNFGRAADAFRLPHNRGRYVPPSVDNGPSRENTPAEELTDENPPQNIEDFHRIVLTFDQEVKVPGCVSFGTDPNVCDVLLAPHRGGYNISYRHFCITFDHKRRPLLKDASTNGVIVSYDDQAKDERRSHFQWIIFDDFQNIHVEVQMKGLAFNVHLPKHEDDTPKRIYEQNVDRFMADAPSDIGTMGNMRLHGPSVPSSAVLSSNQTPIYLERYELGRGAFGKVSKMVDVSTGDEYAGKEFFHKKGWKREIEIMKRLCHVRPTPPSSSMVDY